MGQSRNLRKGNFWNFPIKDRDTYVVLGALDFRARKRCDEAVVSASTTSSLGCDDGLWFGV